MRNKFDARERILDVATDLFYQQGYRATGINEVIEKSGVAKATFYKHFPSKDDLAAAYLENVLEMEVAEINKILASDAGSHEKLRDMITWLHKWLKTTKHRGCAFLHMVSEEPDAGNRLRRPGKRLYDTVRKTVRNLVEAMIAGEPSKYAHLDPDEFTNTYMLLFAGAIALSGIYHENWPVDHALDAFGKLTSI